MITPTPTDRGELLWLAEDLGCPAVRFADLRIEGAPAWRRLVDRSTPSDRRIAMRLLFEPLIESAEGGRDRLEAWGASDPACDAMSMTEARDLAREHLVHHGDAAGMNLVLDTICPLAEPFRRTALRDVSWISAGWESCAWTSSAFLTNRAERVPLRLVVLTRGATRDTVLHELAHVWFSSMVDRPAVSTIGECGITADPRLAVLARAHEAREERRARALSWLWSDEPGRLPTRVS